MIDYEYKCDVCGEVFVWDSRDMNGIPCPECEEGRLRRQWTTAIHPPKN